MSAADLQWQILRKTSCFLVKRRGINKTFTREPFNLKGVNSFRYNGLIKKKAVGIVPAKSGKGVELVVKKRHGQNKPRVAVNRITLSRDARRSLQTIKGFTKSQRYCAASTKLALRRASQLLKSQKPSVAKKTRRARKKKPE